MLALQIAGSAFAGYAAIVVLMAAMQRSLVFIPLTSKPYPAESGVPEMREVTLTTEDGLTLFSWYAPAAPGRPTLLYSHGNGSHIGHRGPRVRPYLDAGFGVFLLEYRGYGSNPGKPTEEGVQADARAAYAFMRGQGIAASDIVLYGESLGTAVAIRLAADQAKAGHPVAAVVLEAPFSSLTDVASHHYPWLPVRALLKDRFPAQQRIAEIDAPLLIAHGSQDRVVPIRFGKKLFEAAVEPKRAAWVEGARHSNLGDFGLYGMVKAFIERHHGARIDASAG